MSARRVSLPGADELFRATGPARLPEQPAAVPPPGAAPAAPAPAPPAEAPTDPSGSGAWPGSRSSGPAERRTTGRERHEEKITVYCSARELIDIERARLTLRGEHGIAVDRGRLVREALAALLADFEAKGPSSQLVRRLKAH